MCGDFPQSSAPTHAQHAHPVVRLLQLMSLCERSIITQSSHLSQRFTLTVVYSVSLEKYIHHCSINQNVFTALKTRCAPLFIPPSPLTLGHHSSFYCVHGFAFSRRS